MDNKFYNTIREYYDFIFPLNKKQVDFVQSEFVDKSAKLIEVGCANGKLTNALSHYDIMGIDLEESFVDIAKSRYPDTDFKALNMMELSSLNEKYDGIICFGNTLVHLENYEIKSFINQCANSLNDEGKLLIQILNYNYILNNHIHELPLIDNENIRFERTYEFGERLIFNTQLIIKSTSETISNSISLTPIRKVELVHMLEDAGFENIKVYSSFNKDELKDNSLPLIISCEYSQIDNMESD